MPKTPLTPEEHAQLLRDRDAWLSVFRYGEPENAESAIYALAAAEARLSEAYRAARGA